MDQVGSLLVAWRPGTKATVRPFSEREKAVLQGSQARIWGQCSDLSPWSDFAWGIVVIGSKEGGHGGKKSCLCRCDCLCNLGVGVRVFHVFHAMDFQPVTSKVHYRLFWSFNVPASCSVERVFSKLLALLCFPWYSWRQVWGFQLIVLFLPNVPCKLQGTVSSLSLKLLFSQEIIKLYKELHDSRLCPHEVTNWRRRLRNKEGNGRVWSGMFRKTEHH